MERDNNKSVLRPTVDGTVNPIFNQTRHSDAFTICEGSLCSTDQSRLWLPTAVCQTELNEKLDPNVGPIVPNADKTVYYDAAPNKKNQ